MRSEEYAKTPWLMKFGLQNAEPKDGTNHDLPFCGHVKSGDDRQRKAENYNIEDQARPNLCVAHYGGVKSPDEGFSGGPSPDKVCWITLDGNDLRRQRDL